MEDRRRGERKLPVLTANGNKDRERESARFVIDLVLDADVVCDDEAAAAKGGAVRCQLDLLRPLPLLGETPRYHCTGGG